MTGLNHVIRRGAVYVWRRRVPSRAVGDRDRYLQVSLRTTRFSTAKTLANVANLAFATSMLEMEHGRITPAEAQSFLARLVTEELSRIEEERYFEPPASSPAEWRTRYLIERSRAVAARMVASRGMGAALFEDDRAELAAEGFSEADLAMVEREIAQVQHRCSEAAFITETCEQASSVLGRGPNSDADVRALVAVRVAAEAEALSRADRRKTVVPYAGLQASAVPVAASVVPVEPPQGVKPKEAATAGQEERKRRYSTTMQNILVDYLTECERLAADKDQKQAEKDLRQKRGILAQFLEAVEVSDLSALRQDDISHYFDVLAALPKNHGKSPADRTRSLDEILERAEGLPPEQVGLSANTVNRNITVLNGFLKFARKRGLHPGEAFELSDYRMKSDDDARQARLSFTEEDLSHIAAHSVWRGCRGETRRHLPGNEVIKDGLFWAPMMASLSGMRREEICGLAAEDVVLDHDIPHIVLRRNHNRGLKNQTSARLVPIHSAILKAGLAEYVAEIRRRQEADLFPDLRPNSASETFGNVLYKKWTPVLVSQLGEGADRKTFHSFRHWVITALRFDASVPKEVVKDLVGHKHSGETDGRYRDASSLATLQQAVERIPSQMWAGLS